MRTVGEAMLEQRVGPRWTSGQRRSTGLLPEMSRSWASTPNPWPEHHVRVQGRGATAELRGCK
jgi:hypothetical protein